MLNNIQKVFLGAIFILLVVLFNIQSTTTIETPPIRPKADTATIVSKKDGTVVIKKKVPRKGVRAFMHKMSKLESNHDYRAVNRLGMLGRYQFSPRTIKAMGFDVSNEEFLESPELQDEVMLKFMRDNRRSLRSLIKKYHGQVVHGVEITEAGILSSAHLVGVGGVLAFFYPDRYTYRTQDSNGTTVKYYLTAFKDFDMSGL